MKQFNYYSSQLEIPKDSEYSKSLKIFDGLGNQTNQIDINLESIPILMKFLKKEQKRLKSLETQSE